MSRKKHQTRSQKLGDFRIDFGRHRGKRLRELPADYLFWVASNECHDRTIQWVARQYLKERAIA